MHDEPESGIGFSYKMSLKKAGIGMLGIADQHGRVERFDPGRDQGISGRSGPGGIHVACAGRDLQVGGANVGAL